MQESTVTHKGPEIEKALDLVKWVQENIRLARWKPELHRKRFVERTAGEVLRRRTANYMNPCLDLTTALAIQLKENGFKPTFVVQELISEHTQKPAFHFALEVQADKKKYTLDFKTGKTAIVYKGQYNPKKSNPQIKNLVLKRFSTEKLERSTTPFQFFGIKRTSEMSRVFSHNTHESLQAAFKAMKRDDNSKLFRQVKARPAQTRHL